MDLGRLFPKQRNRQTNETPSREKRILQQSQPLAFLALQKQRKFFMR